MKISYLEEKYGTDELGLDTFEDGYEITIQAKMAFTPYCGEKVYELLNYIYGKYADANELNAKMEEIKSIAADCKVVTKFSNTFKEYRKNLAEKRIADIKSGALDISHIPQEYEDLVKNYCVGDWMVNDQGIFKINLSKNYELKQECICSHPLIITRRLKSVGEKVEKVEIAYRVGKNWEFVAVPRELIVSNAKILSLANFSIDVSSLTASALIKYFQEILQLNNNIIPIVETVNHLGWVNGSFMPYAVENVCDCSDGNFKAIINDMHGYGDYNIWREHCLLLRNNVYLRLVMAASFASPLIELVNGLPFILHLWGGTGAGKTVALCVAASIWASGRYPQNPFIQSFNSTNYAFTENASFLYSLPNIIDEGQTVRDKEGYNHIVMVLTEGKNRMQGRADGGIRKSKNWNCCFITSGEENLVKYNSGGGTANRVIAVEAKRKIIENGNETMRIISENYGFAGEIYINYIKHIDVSYIKQRYDEIFRSLIQEKESPEKQCVAMSLLLLADELACKCIFRENDILKNCEVYEFMTVSTEVDNSERAYDWITNWIAQNINKFNDSQLNFGEVWGKIDDNIVLINKNVLQEHLSKNNFDYTAVVSGLRHKGYIILTNSGKNAHHTTVNRVDGYYVKLRINCTEFVDIHDDNAPFDF